MPHLVDAFSEGLQTECERGCFDHGAAAEDVAAADRKRDKDLKDVAQIVSTETEKERKRRDSAFLLSNTSFKSERAEVSFKKFPPKPQHKDLSNLGIF